MWQFFAMTTLVLAAATYGLWDQNLKLQKNIAAQRVAIEQQEEAFKELQLQTKQQTCVQDKHCLEHRIKITGFENQVSDKIEDEDANNEQTNMSMRARSRAKQ